MKSASIPENEQDRLKALQEYHLLDTLPEAVYDDITRIATDICWTPISAITLIDQDRQWMKSKQRLTGDEVPRDISFCAHAIVNPEEPFIVTDAREDDRFSDNPLTTGQPHVVFYAGIPLVDQAGYALGALCVVDHRPRTLTANQLASLKALARLVCTHFELRKANLELEKVRAELDQARAAQKTLSTFLTQKARPALTSLINTTYGLLETNQQPNQQLALELVKNSGQNLKTAIDQLPASVLVTE